MYFSATKFVIGIMVALGFIYPLGEHWYLGVIMGMILVGWGWKESYDAMKRQASAPRHKMAGLVLLAILVASVAKALI